MSKTEEGKAKVAYEKEERLIEKNRMQAPAKLDQEIRWAYRSKINESVYCMNKDGDSLPSYSGKFTVETKTEAGVESRVITGQAARILQDAPPKAEFYVSFSGGMNFVSVTREQWGK